MMERCRLRGNDNFCTEITTRPIVPTNTPIQVIKSSKKSSFMCSPLSLLSSYASHGETDSDETLTTKEVSPKLSPKLSPKGLLPKSSPKSLALELSPKGLLLKSSPKSLALELSPKGLPSRSSMISVVSSKDSKSDYESEDNTTVTQQCLLPSNKSTNCKKRTANAPASASASALNSSTSLVKRNRRENSNPK